MSSLLATTWHV